VSESGAGTRGLDFIVFGVPRSGTKALARALSLHPYVYCALERFSYRRDHSKLVFPGSFTRADALSGPHGRSKVHRVRADLARKGEINHVGNKQPRYYFALERVNREVPGLKNIWIYRSPAGFIQSWNRKEARHRTSRWSAGQVGVFGALELVAAIESCARLPQEVFLFPYERGLNWSTEPILQALDFLGADGRLFDLKRFEQKYLPGARDRVRAPLAAHEQELVDALQLGDLDRMLVDRCGALTADEKSALAQCLDSISGRLAGAFDCAFQAYGDNPAVASFAATYFHHYRDELRELVPGLEGSQTLARFERGRFRDLIRSHRTPR
jgi:Sulfotransferase family